MNKRVHISIIALLLMQCSLIGPSRNINDVKDWVDVRVGDKHTYDYIIRWFDPDDHDSAIDSVFGERVMVIDSLVLENDWLTDSLIPYYYATLTITSYDITGYLGKDVYNLRYRLESDLYMKDYGNYYEFLLLPPVEIGQYWHDSYTGINRRISELNATRETHAGVFNDVIIMTDSYCADTIGELWYSPSVGEIIKYIDFRNKYFIGTLNYELTEFERN